MSSVKIFSVFKRFPEVLHAYSTRRGGVSSSPYDSLNLGFSTSDAREHIEKNREIFFNKLGISEKQLAIPKQVHSDHVESVMMPGIFENTDALITSRKNLFLSVQTADCIPVFFYDSRFSVVGIAHSGWRGTAKNIVGKTIKRMGSIFGSSAASIYVALGPGVQGDCYQIDGETASHFPEQYWLPDGPGHYKINIQGIITDQLKDAGIQPDHIEADQTCSHCNQELFYSYRRDGGNSGRMMAVIGLR